MATIRKLRGRWQAIVRRRGVSASKTFDSKAEARAWSERLESQITAGTTGTGTLLEAMQAFERDALPHRRGRKWERVRLAKFARELPFVHKRMATITPVDVTEWVKSSSLMPGSIRREISLLGSVWTFARRTLGWRVESPFRDAIIPPAPKPRTQRISPDQAAAIVAACGYTPGEPPKIAMHRVALAFLFAMETMMRAGEICSLDRECIHARHVHLSMTKNGDERDVPLSAAARSILDLLPGPDVFGLKPGVLDELFRRARDRAAERMPSVAAIHFHDTRREAATKLARKLDVMELARMGGWRDIKVLFATYYAPSIESLADKL